MGAILKEESASLAGRFSNPRQADSSSATISPDSMSTEDVFPGVIEGASGGGGTGRLPDCAIRAGSGPRKRDIWTHSFGIPAGSGPLPSNIPHVRSHLPKNDR